MFDRVFLQIVRCDIIDRILSIFYSTLEKIFKNVFEAMEDFLAPIILPLAQLLGITVSIVIAAVGLIAIIRLRNIMNIFNRPTSPSRTMGNAAFGFLSIQWVAYVAERILGMVKVGFYLTLASYVLLAAAVVVTIKMSIPSRFRSG